MTTHAKRTGEWKPVAVLVPADAVWTDRQGEHVDPTQCTLLHLDSGDNEGWLYSKAEWEADAESRLHRSHRGDVTGLEDGEQCHLLPDICIVKIDETEYWTEDVTSKVKRIFGVYIFDRRVHAHLCSFTPSYECRFLESQWEQLADVEYDDSALEEIDELIREGDRCTEDWTYHDCREMDAYLKDEIREGFFPADGKRGGGVKVTGIVSVTTSDAIEETIDAHHHHSI